MKYVYSAYVAQCEVSHSYNKGVPKNITQRKHSYQHKNQEELQSIKLGWACFDFFSNQIVNESEAMLQDLEEILKGD